MGNKRYNGASLISSDTEDPAFETATFENNNTNPPYKEGRLFYDKEKSAISYYNDESDTTINLGQELVFKVYNNNGANIENGDAVRYDGNIVLGVPTVVRSLADSVDNAVVSGIATHEIEVGETGYITLFGGVGSLDTTAFSEGDFLQVSATVPGLLTNIEQPIKSIVGVVSIVNATEGQIVVRLQAVSDPFAIGQNFNSAPTSQDLTTTPVPLEGYTDSPFIKNLIINTPVGAGGDRRCEIKPLSPAFSGFYEVNSLLTIASSANVIVITELYINQLPTGLVGISDFGSNQIDEGTATLTAFTQQVVDEDGALEIYVYATANTTITIDNILFNAKRLGTV